MQDGDDAALLDGVGDLGAEHVGLGEGDCAGILHCARVVLRHEQLVVLVERVRVVELRLEELEALAGLLKDVVLVHVLGE